MSKHVINTCQNVVLWQRKVSAHCLQSMIDCVIGSWFIVVKSSGWLSTRTEYGRFDRQMHVVLWIIVIVCYFEFYSMKKHTHFQYIVDAISFSSELKFLWIHIVSSSFFFVQIVSNGFKQISYVRHSQPHISCNAWIICLYAHVTELFKTKMITYGKIKRMLLWNMLFNQITAHLRPPYRLISHTHIGVSLEYPNNKTIPIISNQIKSHTILCQFYQFYLSLFVYLHHFLLFS